MAGTGAALILAAAAATGQVSSGNAFMITAINQDTGMSDSWMLSSSFLTNGTTPGGVGVESFDDFDMSAGLPGYSTFTLGGVQYEGIALTDGNGDIIAGLTDLSVSFEENPVINLDFTVVGGLSNTLVDVTSGELTFGAISGGIGEASAAVTVTDNFNPFAGGRDGASFTPNSGAGYLANINGLAPSGVNFASLLTTADSIGSTGPSTFGQSDAFGFAPLGASATSASSRFQFTLSAFDTAATTSTFNIVPTPASAALLGVAGLAAARRRR